MTHYKTGERIRWREKRENGFGPWVDGYILRERFGYVCVGPNPPPTFVSFKLRRDAIEIERMPKDDKEQATKVGGNGDVKANWEPATPLKVGDNVMLNEQMMLITGERESEKIS